MTERDNDAARRDERAEQEAQRVYGDQPTYHQQSDEAQAGQQPTQPDPGYREQDYGGERMYQPDPNEQQSDAG